jgi:hypothetical protein
MSKQKFFFSVLLLVLIFSLSLANLALAWEVSWPAIPGFPDGAPEELEDFIAYVFSFALAIVGIIALLMFIIAAIQYMVSTVAGTKAAAKDKMKNAILGIILLLASYVILNTINPELVTVLVSKDKLRMWGLTAGEVTLYSEENCKGMGEGIGRGAYIPDLSNPQKSYPGNAGKEVGPDLKSIKFKGGDVTVVVCQGTNFEGNCKVYFPGETGCRDIGPGYHSVGIPRCNTDDEGVILSTGNFTAGNPPNPHGYFQCFDEGRHDVLNLMPPGVGNDQASSIQINNGYDEYIAILCRDCGFANCYFFKKTDKNLDNDDVCDGSLNDSVSSLIVLKETGGCLGTMLFKNEDWTAGGEFFQSGTEEFWSNGCNLEDNWINGPGCRTWWQVFEGERNKSTSLKAIGEKCQTTLYDKTQCDPANVDADAIIIEGDDKNLGNWFGGGWNDRAEAILVE